MMVVVITSISVTNAKRLSEKFDKHKIDYEMKRSNNSVTIDFLVASEQIEKAKRIIGQGALRNRNSSGSKIVVGLVIISLLLPILFALINIDIL